MNNSPRFGRSFLWVVLYASLVTFTGCHKTTTVDQSGQPESNAPEITKPGINTPGTNRLPHMPNSCAELPEQFCNAPVGEKGNKRFCIWENARCAEAQTCAQISNRHCDDENYIPGKTCGKRKNTCVELNDCSTFKTPATCQGKLGIGGYANLCSWAYQKNLCESVSFIYDKMGALQLFTGGGTVCALSLATDEVPCWGDDSGEKYSKGFIPNATIKRMALADNFACAEIETKPPSSTGAGDAEFGVKCWGSNAQINNAPNDQIVEGSLRVNNNVACVQLKTPKKVAQEVKCWGDFATTMQSGFTQSITSNAKGILERDTGFGAAAIEARQISLGSDFICVLVEAPIKLGLNPPPVLWCSGKTRFSPFKIVDTSPATSLSYNSLTAGSDFACYLNKEEGPNKGKVVCFEQLGGASTFSDTFLFSGAKFSPDAFDWIKAGPNYLCGMKAADKKPTCYVRPGALLSPASALPAGITFKNAADAFAFGEDFMCGITEPSHKVHCWGSNAAVTGGIPALWQHK